METPRLYINYIKNKTITPEIAADVIYSLNKRVKNWRDRNPGLYMKIRGMKIDGDKGIEKYYRKHKVFGYYREKDFILTTLFTPEKIHVINGIEYLYYRVHRSVFHLPRYVYESYGYVVAEGLKTEKGTDGQTAGEPVSGLLSLQFCKRVIDLIRSGDYILRDN